MHYYQFNIGDYRKDTIHLSRIEHSIYRDLIDWYYLEETQIPKKTQVVTRRLRLGSDSDISALNNVLNDFFTLTEHGYFHGRIEADIAEYHLQSEKNRANGLKGGRPKAKKTQSVTSGLPVVSQVDATANPNHKPLTINQELVVVPTSPKARRKQQLPFDFFPNELGQSAAVSKGLSVDGELLKFSDYHQSKGNTMADWQAAWRTWVGNARPPVNQGTTETNYARSMREKYEQIAPSIAAKAPGLRSPSPNEFFDTLIAVKPPEITNV